VVEPGPPVVPAVAVDCRRVDTELLRPRECRTVICSIPRSSKRSGRPNRNGRPTNSSRRSNGSGNDENSSRPIRAADRSSESTRRTTFPTSITATISVSRVRSRTPGASTRPATAAGSGRCASTPGWERPPRPTNGSTTCSTKARRGCRWRSTCRRRWATTPTTPWPPERSASPVSPSTHCGIWSESSRAFRLMKSPPV
jgi:hypothetical protein